MRVRKEFFLTAPLLRAASPITAGDCVVSLRGQEGYSFIEGPDERAIDVIRDDFVCIIAELVPSATVSFRIVARWPTEPSPIAFDSRSAKPQDWMAWAFSRVSLCEIPQVCLDEDTCKRLEREFSKSRA